MFSRFWNYKDEELIPLKEGEYPKEGDHLVKNVTVNNILNYLGATHHAIYIGAGMIV